MSLPTDLVTDPSDAPSAASARPAWVVLQPGGDACRATTVPRLRRVLLQVAAATVVVLAAVALVGVLIARHSAENESVHQAAELTNVLAESVVQPALTDTMATSSASAAALDPLVRDRVLSSDLVRVKIWSPGGRILYSDEPRLVGLRFDLDAGARRALSDPQVRADITDLDEPENRFERGEGRLLEVHRPIWTPDGSPVLFETYFRYDQVRTRANDLWRGFAGITISSIVAVVVLLVPIAWTLVARARRAHLDREAGLRRAVDASDDERRRIAAALHDGVVQDLVAASLAVSGGARTAADAGDAALADRLDDAGAAVRSGIGTMRALLVEIYPPNLHEVGLERALFDVVQALRVDVVLHVDEDAVLDLDREHTEAAFRVAQECLRNAAAHSGADRVVLGLHVDGDAVVLEIADDGAGFEPDERKTGHFGRELLLDAARSVGAELALRTAPGAGTAWRLRMAT